jgi:hypothetical protein
MLFHFDRDLFSLGQAKQLVIFQMRLGDAKFSLQFGDSIPSPCLALYCRSTGGTDGKMIVDLQQPDWLQMPV